MEVPLLSEMFLSFLYPEPPMVKQNLLDKIRTPKKPKQKDTEQQSPVEDIDI